MKFADVVATGGLDAVATALGKVKGYRVVPLLVAGSGPGALYAAYAGVSVTSDRISAERGNTMVPNAGNITDVVPILDDSWVISPGCGNLRLTGVAGITYRIIYAEDCPEREEPGTIAPQLPGFVGPGGSGGASASYTAAQSSTANIPSLSTDGVSVAGARGVVAILSAALGQTITAAGLLVWWRYSSLTGRWSEGPIQEVVAIGRRDSCSADQLIGPGIERVYAEWRNGTLSAAGSATITLQAA